MRTPKAPAGFVPVDSEEARGIGDFDYVNYAYTTNGRWLIANNRMGLLRQRHDRAEHNYHVQLPPAVEWEEVWGLREHQDDDMPYTRAILTKNGKHVMGLSPLKPDEQRTIVRALNEMEGQNG